MRIWTPNLWICSPLPYPLDHTSNRWNSPYNSQPYDLLVPDSPWPKIIIYSHMRMTDQHVQVNFGWFSTRKTESFVQMVVKMDSCVAEELFYEKIESMKSSRQGKTSNLTAYQSDEIYDKAKAWLTTENSKDIEGLSISDVATIKHKNWTLQHGKIANPDGKFAIPLQITSANSHGFILCIQRKLKRW